MLSILLIDDDVDVRNDLKEAIELAAPDGSKFEIDTEDPFPDITSYSKYIREHDISALVLDERLYERPSKRTGKAVNYKGHDVIDTLRTALPDFPVFVVTTYADDESLQSKWGDFEAIIDRDLFRENADGYTKQVLRSAGRFQQAMQEQLSEMSELAATAATRPLKDDEAKRLAALRGLFGLPFADTDALLVSDLLEEAHQLAAEAKDLLGQLTKGSKK